MTGVAPFSLIELAILLIGSAGVTIAVFFIFIWMRERRIERDMRRDQLEIDAKRLSDERRFREHQWVLDQELRQREITLEQEKAEIERKRAEDAQYHQYEQVRREEEAAIRDAVGAGSGGYIILDLPDERRGIFQDLLKGFEEFARLKGYTVSFSVDSTFHNRIAFKFTMTDPDAVVGVSRIRNDLQEYLDRVRRGDPLDDLPVVTSIQEHEILVTTLKNRISFLQHSYNLAKNSADFYEALIQSARTMPVLPAPSIIVQTGGELNSPAYTALNSPSAVVAKANTIDEHSVRIAVSFQERRQQIDGLDNLLNLLRRTEPSQLRDEAVRNLENVKDELEQAREPEPGRIRRWLERATQAVQTGSLGYEAVHAAAELYNLFTGG